MRWDPPQGIPVSSYANSVKLYYFILSYSVAAYFCAFVERVFTYVWLPFKSFIVLVLPFIVEVHLNVNNPDFVRHYQNDFWIEGALFRITNQIIV